MSFRESISTLFKRPSPIVAPTQEIYAAGVVTPRFSRLVLALAAVMVLMGLVAVFVEGLFTLAASLAFSLLPVALLLVWALKTDRYEPEPKSLVLMVIGLGGALAAVFTAISLPGGLLGYVVKVALVEIVFFLALYGLDANRLTGREFNDHMDGAVYGLALGAGYIAYANFLTVQAGVYVTSLAATVFALERFFTMVFPGLTGWWIGYVKAKYVSVGFRPLFIGFLPVLLLRLVYEGVLTGFAGLALPLRLAATTLVGLVFLAILVRRIRWALEDEKIWGYASGLAPVEKK
ncbi:MAG: hypothetical protein NYU39_03580 [Aigarchaeota archaeon]|nr:hypothetical protein [Candidatus Caldarchaeales archaeon]MDJ0272677.1 hypothetical protein [Candidatus Caldarchaeales archaeon]